MRIEGSAYVVDLSRPQAVAQQGGRSGVVPGAAAPGRVLKFDRVEISPQARELQNLKQNLASLPDVRLDRVALAKQNLQYGGYRVDPQIVAQKMMEGTREG